MYPTQEELNKMAVDAFAQSLRSDTYAYDELLARRIIDWHTAKLAEQEPVIIEAPDYHDEAMGCGLEDRCITDRYEAMRHGWECAVERMLGQIPDEPLYTRPQAAQEWQPIETAPWDTEVIVKGVSGYSRFEEFIINAYRVKGWHQDQFNDVTGTHLSERGWTPTHWKPKEQA